ncbi:MAG: outer membrane lipoprotein carrier protein LolA [Desulfocapsaceae bacterium]|nr:outer membrane lipoprotein carrier protein LolA [Desulfocapsaceae bacterium]
MISLHLPQRPRILFFFPVCVLIILAAFSSIARSAEETPDAIGARLQAKYNLIKSLTFDFTQQSSGQLTGRGGSGSGNAFFLKTKDGSKMLWNYSSPDKQVILSDGTTLSMYFAKLKQMIITPADSLQQDITYSFFSGAGNLEKDFQVLPSDPEVGMTDTDRESFKIIKLVPRRQQSQVSSIHLWVTADSLIQRMEIRDNFDTVTILNFSNIKVDGLSDHSHESLASLFSFTPPEGTEIIRQ